ncbi:MAG: hypothetical protein IJ471_00700 [Eubacterium sp.]|nr:hypothetical protein [Eubacterium sp.]
MITQKQLKEHFLGLSGSIYVWGANCETITEAMIKKLYNCFKSSTYNRAYYDGKLAEGEGKIGSDCSGALYPVSGYDTTAAGYYNRCTKKGTIDSIPKDKVCLVFKVNSSGSINHVGCYTGDGYVSELASSKKNYQRKQLAGNGWDKWGLPDFVDYEEEPTAELKVDGEWGKDTTTKSQQVLDTTVDGIVSNQPVSCQKYVPNALESSWEFERTNYKNGSELIRAIQALCGLTGRDVDGHCGKNTVTAMQKFLNTKGFSCGSIDGIMGSKTVMAWQQYINSRM